MSSSNTWRKGRWVWGCQANNNASDWKDSWACGAISKKTYSTEKEARTAGARHSNKAGHSIIVWQLRGKS